MLRDSEHHTNNIDKEQSGAAVVEIGACSNPSVESAFEVFASEGQNSEKLLLIFVICSNLSMTTPVPAPDQSYSTIFNCR